MASTVTVDDYTIRGCLTHHRHHSYESDEDARLNQMKRELARSSRSVEEYEASLHRVYSSKTWRYGRAFRALAVAARHLLSRNELAVREHAGELRVPPASTEKFPPLAEPIPLVRMSPAEFPTVSVIIVNWNRSQLTLDCIASVHHAQGHILPSEILVLDNGSEASEFATLTQVAAHSRLMRSNFNLHYGEGNNALVDIALGDYIVLLNNDTSVTDFWLDGLISALEEDDGVGAVGAHLLFADGNTQEAGAFVNADGTTTQVGRHTEPPTDWFATTRTVDYCSAACLAMRRIDFEAIGGFDHAFEPAYYEDVDLCLRLKLLLGKKTVFQPSARIFHFEHSTMGTVGRKLGMQYAVGVNRNRFRTRWNLWDPPIARGETTGSPINHLICSEDLRPSIVDLSEPSKDRLQNAPRRAATVEVNTPLPLTFGGGAHYILSVASTSSSIHRTWMSTPQPYSRERFRSLAYDLGIDLSNVTLSEPFSEGLRSADVDITMGNRLFPYKPARGLFGSIYICQFPFPMDAQELANNWHNIDSYDAVVVYSAFAQFHLQSAARRLGKKLPPIHVIPPYIKVADGIEAKEAPKEERSGVVNIGRFSGLGHNKNQLELVRIFSMLQHSIPEWRFSLVGGLSLVDGLETVHRIQEFDSTKKIDILANAASSQIRDLLRSSSWYWHGTGLGIDPLIEPEQCEHFGITPLEAMSHGSLPFVVSCGGPNEYVVDGENGFTYATHSELLLKAQLALSLPKDVVALMRARAVSTAESYSKQRFENAWFKVIHACLQKV